MEQFINWDIWLCPVAPGPAFTHRIAPLWRSPEVDDQKLPTGCERNLYCCIQDWKSAVVLPASFSLVYHWYTVGGTLEDMQLLSMANRRSNWLFPASTRVLKTTGTGDVSFQARELHILSVYQLVADLTCNYLRLIL